MEIKELLHVWEFMERQCGKNMKINMCLVFATTQTVWIVFLSALFSGQLLANQDKD